MTGVLALAQGLAPTVVVPYLGMFFGGIMVLALGLIAGRRLVAPRRHGNVLDINAIGQRAQASASEGSTQSQARAA
jgi:hypothetical protein